MAKKYLVLIFLVLAAIFAGGYFYLTSRPRPPLETKFALEKKNTVTLSADRQDAVSPQNSGIQPVEPPSSASVSLRKHIYQTFNNCGPATLAMILAQYGVEVSQKELGDQMRPYQNPKGDNDDKTIFTEEFTRWAQKYGVLAQSRVNGDLTLLKTLIANGFPVVAKTWLHQNDDIGHFRIVKGYDEERQVIIQDDSYEGPNKTFSYFDFLSLWQPFDYAYIVVYEDGKKEIVEAILGPEMDPQVAWQNALVRAEKESQLDPQNVYPPFNLSSSAYHLGDYQKSVALFELVKGRLPRRMLWYQIEPILAYQKLGDFEKVMELTNEILSAGNRAFSELYQIRGEIYLAKGENETAKKEFEAAIFYNQNFEPAKEALEKIAI